MGNPSSISNKPAVLKATTSLQSVDLDGNREYSLGHDGEDDTGGSDENTIYLGFDTVGTANETEGSDKAKLISGRSIVIGPGVDKLYFQTETGTPTFTVVPSGGTI